MGKCHFGKIIILGACATMACTYGAEKWQQWIEKSNSYIPQIANYQAARQSWEALTSAHKNEQQNASLSITYHTPAIDEHLSQFSQTRNTRLSSLEGAIGALEGEMRQMETSPSVAKYRNAMRGPVLALGYTVGMVWLTVLTAMGVNFYQAEIQKKPRALQPNPASIPQ